MPKKRIAVVDDEPLISILMKELIDDEPEMEIAKMASTRAEFMEIVSREPFDAAMIDISVEGREGGIELLKIFKEKSIELPVVIVSAHDEISYALKCLQAGARGYINKKYICTDVVKCLNEVLAGRLYVSGDKSEHIIAQYRKSPALI